MGVRVGRFVAKGISMTEQTPNEVDRSGQKVGMWTEVDSHGGVKVGEYVEGKRQGV